MKKNRNTINGWINLNKPLGISSTGAVNKAKWLLKPQKIGHAGTLDPLATGILPIALGEGTKCVNLLMDAKKIYEFTVTFGERRSTDDAEGEVVATSDKIPTEAEINAILPCFMGEIQQTPPAYSAIKIDGQRAYALARAGEAVEMKSRRVHIYQLEFLGIELPLKASSPCGRRLEEGGQPPSAALPAAPLPSPPRKGEGISGNFRATVGKGTYIRSLGRDIAQAVGSEGYISRLHRAAVGPFTDAEAISLDFLEESVHKAPPTAEKPAWLWPLCTALDDIPAVALSGEQHRQLRHGQAIVLGKPVPPAVLIAALLEGELVALARTDGRMLHPVRLLNLE